MNESDDRPAGGPHGRSVDRVDPSPREVSEEGLPAAYDLYARGCELLEGGHPHAAAGVLARAKSLEPEKGSIREALARALYQSGRVARARQEFAKAVAIDPVNDYAHFGLGLSCARTGQSARAVGHLKLAIAMRPDEETYRQALARIAPAEAV